jgi:electron transfer flavoprotein beta subunit
MKIAVCVKSVIDVSFPFALDIQNLTAWEDDVFYKVNPADKCAAEVALTLRETYGGEVFFLAYGPPRVEKALRDCLAMGGDQAIRVWDDRSHSGSFSKAYLLAKALKRLSPDLVLCGARSLDEGSGETPVAMAEYLELPQVTGITELSSLEENRSVIVKRRLERGKREEIECSLPALLSVEIGIKKPRYGSLPNALKAKKAKITCLKGDSLEVDFSVFKELDSLLQQESKSLPRPRPKKTFNLESGLNVAQRLEWIMSGGGGKQSKSDFLEGRPEEVAKKLADIILENTAVQKSASRT